MPQLADDVFVQSLLGAWQVRNLVYFLLADTEHKFYDFMKENTHEKINRFI